VPTEYAVEFKFYFNRICGLLKNYSVRISLKCRIDLRRSVSELLAGLSLPAADSLGLLSSEQGVTATRLAGSPGSAMAAATRSATDCRPPVIDGAATPYRCPSVYRYNKRP